jgi:hypothetical protein
MNATAPDSLDSTEFMKNALTVVGWGILRSKNMINAALERIKELETSLLELDVACEGYRTQRDAALDMLFDRGLTLDDYKPIGNENAQEINI